MSRETDSFPVLSLIAVYVRHYDTCAYFVNSPRWPASLDARSAAVQDPLGAAPTFSRHPLLAEPPARSPDVLARIADREDDRAANLKMSDAQTPRAGNATAKQKSLAGLDDTVFSTKGNKFNFLQN